MPKFAVTWVGQLNLIQLDLVTREMHHPRGRGDAGVHADGRQEPCQETRAAGDVVQGELSTVAMRLVVGFADIPSVVKQRNDQCHDGAFRTEALLDGNRAFISDHHAHHRKRHVQRMLPVVIDRIDAVIAGHAAGEQAVEFGESSRNPVERFTGPGRTEQRVHSLRDGFCRTHLHRVCNVIVVTAKVLHATQSKLLGRRTPRAWFSFGQYTLIPPNLYLTRRASVA